MGETRVDLLHLLEDLRDAYAGSLEETILTEIVANSLDSGAAGIRLTTDPGAATLDIVDGTAHRGIGRRPRVRHRVLDALGRNGRARRAAREAPLRGSSPRGAS